jgi:FMN phosphatase YigB (HAD superfamily)
MKRICLDIGNVLGHVSFERFLRHLSKTLNITIEEGQYFLNRTQKLHDLGYTFISDELRDHFKIKSSVIIKELLEIWERDVIRFDHLILMWWEKLREKHDLQIALLSNIGFEHAKIVEENHFPKAIKHFSCHVGARKPSALFYQSFLLEHPEFKGCLYVDDLQENLNASKRFGFQTVRLALNEEDCEEKMREIEELIAKS